MNTSCTVLGSYKYNVDGGMFLLSPPNFVLIENTLTHSLRHNRPKIVTATQNDEETDKQIEKKLAKRTAAVAATKRENSGPSPFIFNKIRKKMFHHTSHTHTQRPCRRRVKRASVQDEKVLWIVSPVASLSFVECVPKYQKLNIHTLTYGLGGMGLGHTRMYYKTTRKRI